MLDDATRNQLEDSGAISESAIMSAKFHLRAASPLDRHFRQYQTLKAEAEKANTGQAEVEKLRQQVADRERELGVTP